MLEIKSYDDWTDTEEELQAEPVENLKRYANYVRSGYYKAGMLNEDNEKEIIYGVKERAYSDGLITDDMSKEEQDSYISTIVGPSQNADANARFVLDHLRTGSESGIDPKDTKVSTLSSYLAFKQAAPDQPSDLQPLVDELLSDTALIKRAKMSAVDRGEYSVAAIDEDDGGRSLYTGPTAKPDSIKGEVDSLLASGALSPSDLYRVDKAVSPINGGLSNTSENFRYEMFRRTVSTLAKTDKDLGDLIESSASKTREEKLAEQRTTGESVWEGVKTAVAYPFLKLADVVEFAGDFVTGEEDVAPAFKPETKVSDALAENDEIRKKFSAEEIEKFSADLTTTAAGAPYRADRPESGVSSDSMGNIIIAPQLLANKQIFETAVTAAPLNAEQQTQARAEREVLLTRSAPELLRVILEEEPEAVGALAKAKASGLSNEQFIEQWVSTPQNYDGFNARLEQFGKSAWKTVAEIPVGIAALSGNEWAAKYLGGLAKDQARREEYSRLFGDEFGVGFQIINAVPQVAADIGLTIGTGGLFAGAKTLVKTASLSSRSLLRASTKFALSNVDEAATLAYRGAAVAGGEANIGSAIQKIGASLATNFAEQAPVFTTAFVRSASSTYGSLYSQLPDTLSHEEKHKNALGYSLAAGLSTGVITAGMGFLGRGGVEEIATKRVRAMLAGETDESILASGAKVVPVDKMNYRQAKQVYENLKNESRIVSDATFQKAMRGAIGSTYKNWLRTTLKGGLNESIEEAMDQGIQMKLEDASLDKETPLAQRVSQVFTAGLIGGTMGGAMGGATQFGKVKKSEMALVYEGRASALDNVVKDLRKNNSGVTADFVERMMDDARAKANAATQADVLAQTTAAKAKETEATANVKEKPVVPIDTFLQAFFGKPKEAAVEQPETTTFLNDLIGESVSVGQFSGTLEMADDGENVRLKLDKPYKQKGGDPVTHMGLGPRLQKAEGYITKYPTLMRTGDDVFGVKAGTPYFLVGSTKEKFAARPLADGVTVDDRFTVLRDDEGVVRSITIKDAVSLKNGKISMPVSLTGAFILRAFAKEYGIDVSTQAPAPEGQQQFSFAEGEIKDTEPTVEEEAAKGTEGQMEFDLDRTPEQQAVFDRFDSEIADLKEKIKDPSINDVRRERLQDRLKGLQKARRNYDSETIQMGALSPDEQARYNSTDVQWNAELDLIRNAYDVNPNVAGATKRILAAPLRNKIGSAIAFGDLDYDTLEAVRDMANEIISFANDEDNQVSDKIRSETRKYYSNLLNRVDIAREFIDERDIDLIKQELENEDFRVTQQLQKPEPKPYPVTNTLHYLISKGKLKTVDIVAGLEAEGAGESLTRMTLTGFKYFPVEREIEFTDADGNVIYFPLGSVDVSSKEIQKKLAQNEVKAKEFIKQEKLAAKATNKTPELEPESEEEAEPEAPLDERVTGFLNLVNDYVNKFNELNSRVTLLKRSKTDQARVKDELKALRAGANNAIKEELTSLVGEIKSRNDLQEDLRSEMIDQISVSIFGKGGFTPVSGSRAQFGKIIEPSLAFKTTAVDYPADRFRSGTQEEALFNLLVGAGQVVNLPTTGATIAAATSMYTTSNGLIKRPAFSEAVVEQVTEEGQEVARPNSYIRDKNNLLRERVHKAYPPLGSIQYKAEGPQGTKVNPKLEAQLRSKQVELSNIKTKAEAKGYDASDKIAVLSKEIAELKKQVKDVPKYKIGRDSYDMVRSQDVTDLFYPVTVYEINGETKTFGVFTNDIEITRAQIARGLHIVIPPNFKGVLNPAIHVAQDGVTVDGYYEPLRDSFVPMGQFRSKLDTRRNSGEEPIDKTRATKYDARAELLVNNMVPPMINRDYASRTSGLIQTVFDGAKRFLYSNAFSPTPDAKLPLTTKGIEDAASDALIDFTSQLNEFLLARHIVTKVIGSLDWKNKIKSQEGQELITRALGGNSSDINFSDLPKELRRLLIKEDSGNLTDAVKGTNLSRYVREMFNGLDDATIAKNIVKMDIGFGGGDPTSIMTGYGMYLFQNATSIQGSFFTVPNPREYLVRTKAIGDKTVKVLGKDFSTIANKHAKRERAEAEELPSISIDAIEEAFGGDFEFSELIGAGARPDWQILLDATQRQKEMGLSLSDYTDNSFNELFEILVSANGHVFNDRGSMLASELMAAVKGDKELGKTFRDIAKMVGLDTPAELAKISDEFLINVLSKKISDDALFKTNNGYAGIVMSQLSETEVGQRAAGLMILKGWLPPVMIEGKRVPLRAPAERISKAPAAPPTPPNASPVGFVIREKAKEVSAAEATGGYVTTIEEAEAYEANKNVALARVADTIVKLGEEKAIALQTIEEARNHISSGFKMLKAVIQPEAGENVLELAKNDFWTNSATVSSVISDFTREQIATIADEISSLEVKLSNYEKLQKAGQKGRNKDLSRIDRQIKKYVKALADPRLPDDSDEKTIFSQKYDELNSLKYHITFNGQFVIDGLNSSISLKQKEIDRINKAVGNGATVLDNVINDIESSLQQLNDNRDYISRLSDKSKSVVDNEIKHVEYLMGLPEWKSLAVATANHPAALKFKADLTLEQRSRVDKYNTSLKVKQDYDAFAAQQKENLRAALVANGVGVFNSGLLTTYVDPVDVVRPEFFEEETTPRPQAEIDESVRLFAQAISPARPTNRKSIDFALSTLDPSLREAARQENTRMMNDLGLVSGDSDSILRALSVLSNRGTAQQQAIVSILSAAPDLIRSVNIGIVDMQAGFAGLYDKSNNTILLNLSEHNGRGLADVLLHELIHAATVRVINNPTTAQQRVAVQRLEQIRNFALAAAVKKGTDTDPTMQLGLSTVEEFVTYALTAPEFMSLLNGLTKPQERTIIRRMIDAVLSIFGFEPKSRQQTSNAIDELLDFTKMSLAHSNTFNMDARWASTLRNEPSENAKASNITRLRSAEKVNQTLRNVAEDSDNVLFATTSFDREYLAAVEAGNMETAQRMVDEAARAAWYNLRGARSGFYANGVPTTPESSANLGSGYYAALDAPLSSIASYGSSPRWKGIDARYGTSVDRITGEVFIKSENPLELAHPGDVVQVIKDMGLEESFLKWGEHQAAVNKAYQTIGSTRPRSDTASRGGGIFEDNPIQREQQISAMLEAGWTERDIDAAGLRKPAPVFRDSGKMFSYLLEERIFDSIIIDWDKAAKKGMASGDGRTGREIAVRDPSQIKSAEPVTYDNNGNVIPLSQRFNLNSNDIRYVRGSEGQGQGTVDAISEIQRILPEGITLEFDNTMLGQLGARRTRPNSIIVNPDTVNDLVYNLTPANARSAVRTFVDEELAHLASYRTFTEDDFVSIAAGMGESMRNLVADMLYSNSESDFAKRQAMIAADLESGALRESDIAAEWVRSEMTRIAVGRSREEHLAFLRTNPSLLAKFIEAVQAFITKLKAQFTTNPTASTAAKISMASRQFRSLRNGGVLPVPEASTAGEMGDVTHFINAVEGNVVEGQEDRTQFDLPIASTNPSKVAAFWEKAKQKMYDMPLELRKYVSQRDGTISNIEYTMWDFAKKYPKLRDAALNAGVAIDDIGTILGTTAPAVQGEARKELQRQVRQFKADNAEDPNLERMAEDYEEKLTQPIADQFYAEFRKNQKVVEDQLRAKGFSALVDYLVEFRQEINKVKAIINFDDTNDVYLTRTFSYFTTEGWSLAAKSGGVIEIDGKTVDFSKLRAAAATHFEWEVLNDAKNEGQTLTEDQVARKTLEALDKYLIKLDTEAKQSKESGTMNTIKRDVNRLLRKKDFDEPLRELLGEVTDPFENAVRTIYSVGRLAANDRFLRGFARQAIKSELASKEPKDGMVLLFPPSENAELGDLAGLYVRSDVAAAIRQELGPKNRDQEARSMEIMNNFGRMMSKVSGVSVVTQTLGSVGFYPRNILGGMALSTAQGIINPIYMREAAKLAIRANLLASDSQETRDAIRRLTELQIVRDETRGRMAMDMFRGFAATTDEQLEELLNDIVEAQASGNIDKIAKKLNIKKEVLSKAGSVVDILAGFNNIIDSAFKINAYMYELDTLKAAYGDTESLGKLEVMAARKVKLTFPTHSDQASLVKSFNRSPFAMLVLPFIRWKSEVLRTMFNTVPLAMEEINSGNATIKARGIKRLVGFSSTILGGGTAFGLVFGTLFTLLAGSGDDEDKDKQLGRVLSRDEMGALREGLPEWQRNHGVFARLIGKDGVQVIDLSNILPYSQLTDVFKLGLGGDAKGIAQYLVKDLIGTQIAAGTLIEAANNTDDFGNPIVMQSDNALTSFVKLSSYVGKNAFQPSAYKKLKDILRYGQQDATLLIAGELTGARPMVHKLSDIEYRAMNKIKTTMDENVSMLSPLSAAKAFDPKEAEALIDKHQTASNTTQKRLYNFMQNMKSMGSTEESLLITGDKVRISELRLSNALMGRNSPWIPNAAWFNKLIQNKERGGEQDPNPLIDEVVRVVSNKADQSLTTY
jgi:hypothetical protein